ncbi:Arc-like DNA binding domain-containing protein, partial [Dysosmobacter welbionis]
VGCLVPLFPPAVELPRKVEAAGAAVLGLLHRKPGQDEAPTVGTAEMAQFNPPKGGRRSNSHGQ